MEVLIQQIWLKYGAITNLFLSLDTIQTCTQDFPRVQINVAVGGDEIKFTK